MKSDENDKEQILNKLGSGSSGDVLVRCFRDPCDVCHGRGYEWRKVDDNES